MGNIIYEHRTDKCLVEMHKVASIGLLRTMHAQPLFTIQLPGDILDPPGGLLLRAF